MYDSHSFTGQPADPPRPSAPVPVVTAVRLIYAGAAVSTVTLIISLAVAIDDVTAAARGLAGLQPQLLPDPHVLAA